MSDDGDLSSRAEDAAVERDAALAKRMGLPPSEDYIRTKFKNDRAKRKAEGVSNG